MAVESEMPNSLEVFKFCREEVKHEYNVLGTRLTSYITSQSFLFASYSVSMSNPNTVWGPVFRLVFPLIVCAVGLATTMRAQPGIRSVCEIINALHKRQLTLYEDSTVQALDPTDTKWMIDVHNASLRFSEGAAYIFGVAWIVLLPLAGFVYWKSMQH
jgi:hypothetical protein